MKAIVLFLFCLAASLFIAFGIFYAIHKVLSVVVLP